MNVGLEEKGVPSSVCRLSRGEVKEQAGSQNSFE